MSLWRNRLARSTVNRKAGGSSPPRDVFFSLNINFLKTMAVIFVTLSLPGDNMKITGVVDWECL